MQLQNFECQIAKAQIGRFVAGDKLSDEALQQLEAHISKCQDCQQSLAERRAALQAMLGPQEAPPEPPSKAKIDIAKLIKSKLNAGQQVQAAVQSANSKPSSFTKPAIYSLALAGVLIAMSYMSRNMDSVLGPKAAASPNPATPASMRAVAAVAPTHPVVHAQPPKDVKPASATPEPPAKSKSTQVTPKAEPAKPSPTTARAPKPQHRLLGHRGDSGRHHDSNTVRVYDPEN